LLLWLTVVGAFAYGSHSDSGPNLRPIIGILTINGEFDCPSESRTAGDGGCVVCMYVDWVYGGGARVVPIPYNAPSQTLDDLFNSVNGLFITGGNSPLVFTNQYVQTAQYLFNKAIAANDAGDFFPIWGSCLGFELMGIIVANNASILSVASFVAEGLSIPLEFEPGARQSRLFGPLCPDHIFSLLSDQNVTVNLHRDGFDPAVFYATSPLTAFFDVLSTNVDEVDSPFISSIEAKRYPFYGVQFHPERPAYDWQADELGFPITHTTDAILCGQYFGNFFVSEARRSSHRFASPAKEDAALIANTEATYLGEGQCIYFL